MGTSDDPYGDPDTDPLEEDLEDLDDLEDGALDEGFSLDDIDPRFHHRIVFARPPFPAAEQTGHPGERLHRDGLPRFPVPRVPAAHAGPPPPPRRWIQVNIRLTPAAHRDLCRAAELLELKPTQLARVLVRNGTEQALREHLR